MIPGVDREKLERTFEARRKTGIKRCPCCGRDVEDLFANNLEVSLKQAAKMEEIVKGTNSYLKVTGTEKYFNTTLSDLDLKPILDMIVRVDVDTCRECIERIGWIDKFKFKQRTKKFITSRL